MSALWFLQERMDKELHVCVHMYTHVCTRSLFFTAPFPLGNEDFLE